MLHVVQSANTNSVANTPTAIPAPNSSRSLTTPESRYCASGSGSCISATHPDRSDKDAQRDSRTSHQPNYAHGIRRDFPPRMRRNHLHGWWGRNCWELFDGAPSSMPRTRGTCRVLGSRRTESGNINCFKFRTRQSRSFSSTRRISRTHSGSERANRSPQKVHARRPPFDREASQQPARKTPA